MSYFRKSEYSLISQSDDSSDVPLRPKPRQEPTLEATVLPNDNLASISLRFNCSVQELKRLNKIANDNEIFALKCVKIPLNAQNSLVFMKAVSHENTIPQVHSSGQNSPKNKEKVSSSSTTSEVKETLEEKLMLASVSNAVFQKSPDSSVQSETTASEDLTMNPMFRGYPSQIRGGNDYLSFNGGLDCNWIVLLVCILLLCVLLPLIYVFYVYEHPEDFVHPHIKYDDPDPKILHHLHQNVT